MADNDQQWEELDNSEDNSEEYEEEYEDEESSDQDEYDEEQSDEDEDQDEEEYEEDEDDDSSNHKQGNNNLIKIIIILLILLLIGGGGFFLVKSMSGHKDQVSSEIPMEQAPAPSSNNDVPQDESFFDNTNNNGQDGMNVSFNENGDANINDGQNNGDMITISEAPPEQSDDMFINNALEENQANDSIMVSYNQASRLNPFKPPIITSAMKAESPYVVLDNTEFEIIEPPAASTPDENLTKLLQTQISGILYDDESPSAIINLNGTDYFVKIGDKISGYVIKNITRDKVQVNYKNNTYVASVGQLFTRGILDQRNVADFEHKFAGRNKNKNN